MSGSNPMEFAFFLLLNLLRANGSLPATSNNNKELIFATGGFHHHKHHHPIIRHNNPLPLINKANEFQEMASKLPIKKLPLREMAKRGQQKRLTLYPTMDFDEKQQNQLPSPAPSIPQKSHHSWQKHRRPMHWLGHRGETKIGQKSSGNGGKKYEFVRESIQTCLFLRSGCQKIQHSVGHSNRRLASFVQNLDVQERISNGFVLQRKSKKKKTRRSRLL